MKWYQWLGLVPKAEMDANEEAWAKNVDILNKTLEEQHALLERDQQWEEAAQAATDLNTRHEATLAQLTERQQRHEHEYRKVVQIGERASQARQQLQDKVMQLEATILQLKDERHGMEHAQVKAEQALQVEKIAHETTKANTRLLAEQLRVVEQRYHDLVKQLIAPKLAPPEPAKVVPGDPQAEDQYRDQERHAFTPQFRTNMIQGLIKDYGIPESQAREDADEILRDLNGDMSHALTDDERANLNV